MLHEASDNITKRKPGLLFFGNFKEQGGPSEKREKEIDIYVTIK